MVSEIEKDMSSNHGRKLMERIETSLMNVCSTDRLRAYKFSPPTQVKTCTAILAKYRMSLTNILREQYRGGKTSSVETLTNLFCTEGTKACEGREVPTLQQRKEREEVKRKSEEKKEKEEKEPKRKKPLFKGDDQPLTQKEKDREKREKVPKNN